MRPIFTDRSEDEEYIENVRQALNETANLYQLFVQKARDMGFTDERTIQAVAFTLRGDVERRMSAVEFWKPSEDRHENARDLQKYAAYHSLTEPEAARKLMLEGGEFSYETTDETINDLYDEARKTAVAQGWPMPKGRYPALVELIWYMLENDWQEEGKAEFFVKLKAAAGQS